MSDHSSTVFRNVYNCIPGHTLCGTRCDVAVNPDGTEILPIHAMHDAAAYEIDGSTYTLLPGLVELHAEANQPGREDREQLNELLSLAAMGGFTQVMTMPLVSPVADNRQVIEYQLKTVHNDLVDLLPAGAISKGAEGKELAEMYDMKLAGALAFSDYKNRIKSSKLLLLAMQYARQFDLPLMLTPGDAELLRYGMVHEGVVSTHLGLKGIPSIAESIGLKRDLDLVRYTHCRVHFQSVSTKESVELIRMAKDEGLPVTADVSFYHLILTDDVLASFDSNYKTDPPLRDESVRQALIDAVLDGTIDAISADHQPRTYEEKVCEFDKAHYGMFTLPFVFGALHKSGIIPLDILVEKMSINPKKILRIDSHYSNGYILVNMEDEYMLSKTDFKSYKSLNSPFFWYGLKGKIEYIINKNKWRKNS